MIRRILAGAVIFWLLGFVLFSVALPQPVDEGKTDAVVVPTGSGGRIARGLEVLRRSQARKMLVTGVDPEVKPKEFAAQFVVEPQLMQCCVTLGAEAADTRGNALETADWMRREKLHSLRLVTSDWHMRRAALELRRELPDDIELTKDAVATQPTLRTLFLEYNKLLASFLAPIAMR
ncbi:MAG: YdcF family protein [Novosphingobium sp.]